MSKNFFTAFYSALSDPASYLSFQKEMNMKAMEQVFFNTFAGKTSFDAIVLPEDLGSTNALNAQSTTAKAIRVRPKEIHSFILPEPCEEKDLEKRKKIIAMHPVAYPDSNFPVAGGSDQEAAPVTTGMIVECKFSDGPGGGRLRGLTYTKTNSYTDPRDLACFGDISSELKKAFESSSGFPVTNGNTEPIKVIPIKKENHEQNKQKAIANYDNNASIPNKDQHKKFFDEEMHNDFAPYVKLIVAEAWTTKQISVKFNSTFRTVGSQKRLFDAWNGWIATLPADKRSKIGTYKDWVDQGKPGGNPPPHNIVRKPATPGYSNHNFGTAMDFTITYKGKNYGSSQSKEKWLETGFPQIIAKHGVRWGGLWGGREYDPIHLDISLTKDMKKAIRTKTASMVSKKDAIAEINKVKIFE